MLMFCCASIVDNFESGRSKDKVYQDSSKKITRIFPPQIFQRIFDIIKLLPQHLRDNYLYIFNECLYHQCIPKCWKHAIITLVHKKGDKGNPSNFRPIALLQTTYKLFSLILTHRFLKFVEQNHIISPLQAGFRKKRSTSQQISILTSIFEDRKQFNRELHALFIDFQKAYDSVEHNALLETLRYYNVDPKFIELISNIYQDTDAVIRLNIGETNPFKLTRGVRQGDPLSPILFITFINPLIEHLDSLQKGYSFTNNSNLCIPVLAFADDLVLLSNDNDKMKALYEQVVLFAITNGIHIGVNKSAYTYIKPNNNIVETPFKYQDKEIPFSTQLLIDI